MDVLTTMFDKELLLTQMEYEEGVNLEDKTYYKYLKSYSHYENFEEQNH